MGEPFVSGTRPYENREPKTPTEWATRQKAEGLRKRYPPADAAAVTRSYEFANKLTGDKEPSGTPTHTGIGGQKDFDFKKK